MTKDSHSSIDLRAIAHQAMINEGFQPDMPPDVAGEVQARDESRQLDRLSGSVRDLRSLKWSSIDNVESRDLDQVEYAEQQPNGDIRVMIGIADVDAFAPEDSATDRHAARNTISVYTGVETFPMLPE